MNQAASLPEFWQRGPVAGVPALLQPVAHALLQAKEEVNALMAGFPATLLWVKPAGVASPAFHLQHMTGVIDRLFTYARGEMLQPGQLAWLKSEGQQEAGITVSYLLDRFNEQVDTALEHLKKTGENTLTEFRGIGRAQLPSNVLGLLVHTAEHTMRHLGQLIVTVRVLLDTH